MVFGGVYEMGWGKLIRESFCGIIGCRLQIKESQRKCPLLIMLRKCLASAFKVQSTPNSRFAGCEFGDVEFFCHVLHLFQIFFEVPKSILNSALSAINSRASSSQWLNLYIRHGFTFTVRETKQINSGKQHASIVAMSLEV